MTNPRSLLGQQVVVTIGREEGAPIVVRGQLLGFGDDGTFETRDDMGIVHYSWPMLDIRADMAERSIDGSTP